MGCPTVPRQDKKWLFPRTILGGPGENVCSSRSSNKNRNQFNIGKERSNLFFTLYSIEGLVYFLFLLYSRSLLVIHFKRSNVYKVKILKRNTDKL